MTELEGNAFARPHHDLGSRSRPDGPGVADSRSRLGTAQGQAQVADLILHSGKIATVDREFSIRQAVAVKGDRLILVGTNADVMKLRGPTTRVVDLGGKLVLPGLIDSHTHPTGACMTEFDHPVPDMETIQDVLDYIQKRAQILGEGEWVVVRQVFITRLKEQRYPTPRSSTGSRRGTRSCSRRAPTLRSTRSH